MPKNSFSLNRRCFLGQGAQGVGVYALASLFGQTQGADVEVPRWPGILNGKLHREAKAKRVIFLTMAGGMSHLETFDNKPKLRELDGQPMPESYTKGQPIAQLQNRELRCRGGQHEFKKHGESGNELSAIWEHLGSVADDIAIIRSLKTEAINHDPAHTFMNTGTTISGRPSMGSWLTYGLGSETENLPGFVVLTSSGGGQDQPIASRQWHSGFLPSRFQGVHFHSQGDPVLYVNNPPGIDREGQGDIVKAVQQLNQFRGAVVNDPEITTRISQYEMAFRMQASVPGLMDTSDETQTTLDLYGTKGADGTFAANCLLARRLAERGCRFIQLYHSGWDAHSNVEGNVRNQAKQVDQASAALVQDLKRLGMLEDTLVVWGGEFGRTPMVEASAALNRSNGRDHHPQAFTMLMAGGGSKPGISLGKTDELGFHVTEDPVHVHDLQATILKLMGIDHTRLSFRFQGLDFRLTGVEPHHPVEKLIA